MNRNAVFPLLGAGILGIAVGFLVSRGSADRQKVTPSVVLEDFSFGEFIAQVDSSQWQVIEDRVYDRFPPSSRSPRIARRIVAHTAMLDSDEADFASRYQRFAEEWITSRGAMIKGQQDANLGIAEAVNGGEVRTLIDFPRRYYAIGNTHGVADFGCAVRAGTATIVVCLIEGP